MVWRGLKLLATCCSFVSSSQSTDTRLEYSSLPNKSEDLLGSKTLAVRKGSRFTQRTPRRLLSAFFRFVFSQLCKKTMSWNTPRTDEISCLPHSKSRQAECLGMKIQAGPGGSPANYLEILHAALHQQTLRWNLSLGNLTSQRVTRELNFRSLNWVLSWNHLSPRRSLHVPNTADFLTHLRQICGGSWLIFKTLPSFSCLSKVWRKLEITSIKSNYMLFSIQSSLVLKVQL